MIFSKKYILSFPAWKCGYMNNRTTFCRMGITPYWWAQDRDWMPYWGKETEMRAQLMKELRAYWTNEWFGKTIPKIKNMLLETTKLIPDIVEHLRY